jgi:hypothetical protein
MRTPGFTAEIALQGSGRTYQASAGIWSATSLVQPAINVNLRRCIQSCSGDDLCVECCICIARGGSPQHCCM